MTSGNYMVALECYPLSLLTYYAAYLISFYAVASRSSSLTECSCLHIIFYFYYLIEVDNEFVFALLRCCCCFCCFFCCCWTISSALRIRRRFEIIFWFDTQSNTYSVCTLTVTLVLGSILTKSINTLVTNACSSGRRWLSKKGIITAGVVIIQRNPLRGASLSVFLLLYVFVVVVVAVSSLASSDALTFNLPNGLGGNAQLSRMCGIIDGVFNAYTTFSLNIKFATPTHCSDTANRRSVKSI